MATAPAGGRKKGAVLVGPATGLKAAARRKLEESLTALGATGKSGDLVRVPGAGIASAPVVLAVGIGAGPWSDESLRRSAGDAARALTGVRRAVLAFPVETPADLDAVVQGAALGSYAFLTYRADSKSSQKAPVGRLSVQVADPKDAASLAALGRGRARAAAVNRARDLVNTPSADLVPAHFAEHAVEAAAGLAIDVEVLDEQALADGGYGGILAVGRGSAHAPRLVRLAYRPEGATTHLALVGKGITFDTGGISIKPSAGMHEMKGDMGGAAAALGAILAAARLGIAVNITSYLCLAENMPSSTAQKPGDVYIAYGGKTVEVLDTDAEGRLVLADALVRAQEDQPDDLIDTVHDASRRAGEQMWPMPQPEELRANLDSMVADNANIPLAGRREGGMLSASIFLREFVSPSQRWAHLDIASPSYNGGSAYGYTPRGATGVSIRTLVQVAEDLADGAL